MGPVLTDTTVVRNPDTGRVVVLYAGAEVPAWAEDQIGVHLIDTGSSGGDGVSPDPEAPTEPPRAGRGSGLDAWVAYAASQEIEIPEGASRDEVIDLVDQHKSNA